MSNPNKILETKWFSLNTVSFQSSNGEPYYYFSTPDSVEILAITEKEEIILVRQFRPAIGISMLELPAGYIEQGEESTIAAKRELIEDKQNTSIAFIYSWILCFSPTIIKFSENPVLLGIVDQIYCSIYISNEKNDEYDSG